MWLAYLFAVLACIALLYLPGYLLARSFPFSWFASAAIAPVFSMMLFTVAGAVAYEIARPCPPSAIILAVFALCLIAFAARKLAGKGASELLKPRLASRELARIAALYVVASLAIFFLVYLLGADGPYSFSRNDDSTVHLSLTRGFMDTGTFSTLHTSSFLDQDPDSTGYYPAAWHVLCALLASITGGSVALSFNAAITVFLVLAFPLGMLCLFEKIFRRDKPAIVAGSILVLAFCGFPWGFIVWGQLLPNMAAFIFIPVVLAAFAGIPDATRATDRAKLIVAVLLGFASIALAQPNGVFTLGILIVAYAISRLFFAPDEDKPKVTAGRVGAAIAIFAFACALWVAMYNMPFLQSVVNYTWKASLSPFEALVSSPFFMFSVRQGVQPLLTLLTVVGIVKTLRDRRYLWLTVVYLAALIAHIIGTSTDSPVKQLLVGFWYTDYNRTGAMCALFAIPVASLGLAWIASWMKGALERRRPGKSAAWYAGAVAVVVAIVFALLQFTPIHVDYRDRQVYLSLSSINHQIGTRYSWENGLTAEEDGFIRKAMDEVLPEGALVINVPSDGSCWSYGVEGINMYFRRSSNTGARADGEEAALIRTKLNQVATNQEVQQTLRELDARYLLILDDLSSDNPTRSDEKRYNAKDWTGIESITPETPGFELVLSEGDMRLYEIEAVEES